MCVGDLLFYARSLYPTLENAHLRALLAHLLQRSSESLFAFPETEVSLSDEALFLQKAGLLAGDMPLSRILGKRSFWKDEFLLSEETLDPRPDSECLIEAALHIRADKTIAFKILDLGTGSGCLLLSLLREYPKARGTGVDVQEGALHTARENAVLMGLQERASFFTSDWCEEVQGTFDLIISNPPYISDKDYEGLAPGVRLYDPPRALKGGADGLEAYRALLAPLRQHVAAHGHLLLEIGWNQKAEVTLLLENSGFKLRRTFKDLGEKDRILVASPLT